jgi:hypothetical protein
MLNIIKSIILIFLVFFTHSLFAAEPPVLQADDVTVVFDESLRSVAEEVRDLYPTIKQDLEKMLLWYVDFMPTLVLIKHGQQFQQISGTDLIVAFAVPQKKLMVIDYSKMRTSPFSLKSTIKHELCHLVLHHYVQKERLPRWLDEGISQWASDGITELIMDHKRSILRQAMLSGRYFRMNDISRRFPRDKTSLQLAYAQSRSFVDFMIREFGRDGVLRLINNLRHGLAFETAIEESFAVSFEDLEKEWVADHTKRNTWFTYLSIHVYEFIFLFGAIAVVIGFIRVIKKKRRYSDLEDDEE